MAYDQILQAGSTSQMMEVALRSSSTGQLLTGVAYGSITAKYIREGSNTQVTVSVVTMTQGTFASGGWVETGIAGVNQFGIPDAAIAAGVKAVTFVFSASGAIDAKVRILLVNEDLRDALISSRLASGSYTAPPTANQNRDAVIAGLQAEDPPIPANVTYQNGEVNTVPEVLATIAGYVDTEVAAILAAVDTEVAAIKAKTDNLPAAPAATGDIPTAAAIRAEIDANSTQLAAIVADTNELQTDWADGGRLDLILDNAGAAATPPTVEEIRAEIDSNSTQLAAIVADTNELQTNQGNWLTADVSGLAQTGADGDTLETLSDQIDLLSSAAGAGATSYTITVEDESNDPIDGVEVWITTDSAGTNVVAGTLTTDAMGLVIFMLDAGDYYVWRQASGYNFTNPVAITVS